MKYCAVISEYNPFHNGHKYQLDKIRRDSGCDAIICFMSGNFTQRGEAALFHKLTRARHAVENGADAVVELPVAFSVAPAELFARGAVKLACSVPAVETLAFGCECGTKEGFLAAAQATLAESKELKAKIKENMKDGVSYKKALTDATLSLNSDIDEALLTNPNNLLGVEYCRALLSFKSKISPLPILRVGSGYADENMLSDFSSATALRSALNEEKPPMRLIKRNLPKDVFRDAKEYRKTCYKELALSALLMTPAEKVSECADCSEGLENRLKAMSRSNPDYDEALKKTVSKRYTLSRLKRILCENLLGISLKTVKEFLDSALYLKTLAVKKENAEAILSALSESKFPVVARKSDALTLKKSALDCFRLDVKANDVYNVLSHDAANEYETLFV